MRERTPVSPPRKTWNELIQERAQEAYRRQRSAGAQQELVWNGHTAVPWYPGYELTNATVEVMSPTTLTVTSPATHFK